MRIFFRARFDWLYVVLSLMVSAGILSVFAFLLTNMENLVSGKHLAFQCMIMFFWFKLLFSLAQFRSCWGSHQTTDAHAHTQEMRREKKTNERMHTPNKIQYGIEEKRLEKFGFSNKKNNCGMNSSARYLFNVNLTHRTITLSSVLNMIYFLSF